MRYCATLAYDGTNYQGFQRQRDGIPTIQTTVETAILEVTGQVSTVVGAGRTDSGVHATGQVIAFDVEWQHSESALMKAINVKLPYDIAIQDICIQKPDFHPRFDALSRRYQYYILHADQRHPLMQYRAWHIWGNLDFGLMQASAKLLVGEHDFATFGHPPQGISTIRTVFVSEWRQEETPFGSLMIYQIEANAFLYHMVRRIVGMIVGVGLGHRTLDQFHLAFKQAHITNAGSIAPPQGLILDKVRYR